MKKTSQGLGSEVSHTGPSTHLQLQEKIVSCIKEVNELENLRLAVKKYHNEFRVSINGNFPGDWQFNKQSKELLLQSINMAVIPSETQRVSYERQEQAKNENI